MSNICRFTVPASRDLEKIIDYIANKGGLNSAESYLNL
jgi:toxin ParE1/3/4